MGRKKKIILRFISKYWQNQNQHHHVELGRTSLTLVFQPILFSMAVESSSCLKFVSSYICKIVKYKNFSLADTNSLLSFEYRFRKSYDMLKFQGQIFVCQFCIYLFLLTANIYVLNGILCRSFLK